MMTPKIAAIVVSFNEKDQAANCIDTLIAQHDQNVDIFLIDNASNDGTPEYIKEKFPQVTILKNSKNLGFAKAINLGMKSVFDDESYDFSLILNSDLKADKNMLVEMMKTYRHASKTKKVGIIQPVLLIDGTNKINSSGNPIHFLGFGYAGNYGKPVTILENDDCEVVSVPGGAMMVTKAFYKDVGGFDESFFMYCEDQDLCWRGLLKGYTFMLSRKALLFHKYHFSKHKKKLYYYERNRHRMLLKNYSFSTLLLISPLIVVNEIMLIFYSLINGWLHFKIMTYFSNLLSFPEILRRRKVIQQTRIVTDKVLLQKMSSRLDFSLVNVKYISSVMEWVNKRYQQYYKVVIQK